jgi:hypothetical protein
MDADVIAVNVVRWMLVGGGIETESDAALQFVEKTFSGPSMS